MISAEVPEFIDLSGNKNCVVLDWLEFTLFKVVPPYLKGTTETEQERELAEHLIFKAGLGAHVDEDFERMFPAAFPVSLIEQNKNFKWRAFTVKEVCTMLGSLGEKAKRMEKGMHGYNTHHVTAAGVKILSDGNADMGVHVIISGQTCQRLSEVQAFVKNVLDEFGKFTRVDLAVDEYTGKLPLVKMIKKCKKGECSSCLRSWSVIESGLISDGSSTGRTLYLGSRESDVMARAYDKWLQLRSKGYPKNLLPKSWIRFELEIKGAAAINTAKLIAAGELSLSEITFGLIKRYVNFKDAKGPRKDRWKVSEWWADWLGSVSALSVAKSKPVTTIERRMKWFRKQCAPSMVMVMDCHGSEYMTELWKAGNLRITDKQQQEVETYKKKRTAVALEGHHKGRMFDARLRTQNESGALCK